MAGSELRSGAVGANYSSPALAANDDNSRSSAGDDNAYTSLRAVFAAILIVGLVSTCALVVYILRGQRRLGSRDPPQLNVLLVTTHAAANLVSCLANGIWIVYQYVRTCVRFLFYCRCTVNDQ